MLAALVIQDGPDKGALVYLATVGAVESLDMTLDKLKIIFKVCLDVGDAGGCTVVDTNWSAVNVPLNAGG